MGIESMTHDQIMQYSDEVSDIPGVEVRDIANAHGHRSLEDKFQSLFVVATRQQLALLEQQPHGPAPGEVISSVHTISTKLQRKLGRLASGFAEGFMISPISVFAPRIQVPKNRQA